ncbi:MAG: AtpZ/AtpI family protein [Clostridiales bacterium]|nr:AtpZ/AtpI family protein [Clostridiales bacterium]
MLPQNDADREKAEAERKNRREIAGALSLVTQLGLSMFACIFLGVWTGKTLDERLGTTPTLLMVGVLLGAAASFKVLYDLAIKRWMK